MESSNDLQSTFQSAWRLRYLKFSDWLHSDFDKGDDDDDDDPEKSRSRIAFPVRRRCTSLASCRSIGSTYMYQVYSSITRSLNHTDGSSLAPDRLLLLDSRNKYLTPCFYTPPFYRFSGDQIESRSTIFALTYISWGNVFDVYIKNGWIKSFFDRIRSSDSRFSSGSQSEAKYINVFDVECCPKIMFSTSGNYRKKCGVNMGRWIRVAIMLYLWSQQVIYGHVKDSAI